MYNLVVMENFGEWLKRCRKERGWTQEDLHQKSGVSASYISTLERTQPHSITGATLRPEPNKVEKLATSLGKDISEALLLAGYAPQNSNESHEILDGATVSFDERKFSKAEQAQLIEAMRLIAAGVKARKAENAN